MKFKLLFTFFLFTALPLPAGFADDSPSPTAMECAQNFLEVFPDCISDREPPQTPSQLLQGDLKVCGCIDSSPLLRAAQESSPSASKNLNVRRSQEALQFESSYYTQLALNSSFIASTEEELNKLILVNTASGLKNKMADIRRALDPNQQELGTIDSRVLEINKIPTAAERQCVTFNEYNALRILPQSSNFYRQLQETNFNREEWDIQILARRYDSETNPEVKSSITERINFLQRNPQVRYVFTAQASGSITSEQVLERQRGVYDSLRLLLPPTGSNCLTDNRCGDEAIRSARFAAFNQQLNNLFKTDPVLDDMTNGAQTRDLETQIRELINSPAGTGPDNIEEYFYYLQNNSGDLVRRCSDSNADISCYSEFKDHCKRLRTIDRRIKENASLNGEDILRRIQQQDRSETNLNLAENLDFQQFNDQMCLQVFKNTDGEELSFFGFQDKYCTETSSLPECGDRRALLRRYLREYTIGEGDAILSSRTTLSDLIEDQNFVDISSGALEAANQLNETPAQLRERFGGLYPRIGNSGELLPPLPRSAGSSNSGASSESSAQSSSPPSNFVSQPSAPTSISPAFTSDGSSSSGTTVRGSFPARSPASASTLNPAIPSGAGANIPFRNASSPGLPIGSSSRFDSQPEASPAPTLPEARALAPSAQNLPQNQAPTLAPASGGVQAQIPLAQSSPKANSRSQAQSLPSVRPRDQFNKIDFGNRALMDRYDSSEDMQFKPIVDFKTYVLRGEDIRRYENNPQLLAKNSEVARLVRDSPNEIVELTVAGPSGREITVFAKLEGNNIAVYESLFGATRKYGRSIASESSDFRVHVKQKTYNTFKNNPMGILMDSQVYERILYSNENEFQIFLTTDTDSPLTFNVRKSDGDIVVTRK